MPLVENNEEMVSFEVFSSVKCSHGLSPCWRSVSQDWNPGGMEGFCGVLKIKILVLGIGTERLLFESVIVESCSGDVMMYLTDV